MIKPYIEGPSICANCEYWTGEPEGDENREGECRRYPPTVHFVPVRTLAGDGMAPVGFFPMCRSTITCGEFQHKRIVGD